MTAIPNRRVFLQAGMAASAALAAGNAWGTPPQPTRRPVPGRPTALDQNPGRTGGIYLPQDDHFAAQRQRQLARDQQVYQYEYSYISPLALIREVPLRDKFSVEFLALVGSRALDVLENLIAQRGDARDLARHAARRRSFEQAAGAAVPSVPLLLEMLQTAISNRAAIGQPQNIDDYAALFRTIGLPPIAQDFHQDKVFGLMRVAGPNPLMLQRIDAPDSRFPVNDEIFQQALPGDSLLAAAGEGRLYLADFELLDLVEAGNFPSAQKFIYAPLALFAVEKHSGDLVPVAIQCHQQPGPENPIFTPGDRWSWMIAKTIVEIADANVHEMVSHLGRTHLYIEPFGIATQRQLAANHPLHILLRPHFEGTFAINKAAHQVLVADQGPVDRLLSGTIDASRALAAYGVQSWPFNAARPPDTFRARGVDDAGALPHYPYRDDSLLYWAAIRRWTESYVSLYYKNEAAVQNDHELAKWAGEVMSSEGGRIPGFGEAGGIATRDYLLDATAQILFTASVQHAAVGYPQFDLMSYVPNMPLAGYAPAPLSKTGYTEQDFLDLLPPLEMANLQLAVLYGLGTVQFTQLGSYDPQHFTDRRVGPLLAGYQRELDEIGAIIDERNLHRRPYEFLARNGIPQSINI